MKVSADTVLVVVGELESIKIVVEAEPATNKEIVVEAEVTGVVLPMLTEPDTVARYTVEVAIKPEMVLEPEMSSSP